MLSRFLRAANATLFGQLIARFGSFLLLPMFLARWSPAVYGEWLALYAAVGYLSSLDVGMQAATLNRLTAAYARHDLGDYKRAQNSALAVYIGIAAIGLVILVVVATTMPIGRWLGLRVTKSSDAALVLVLLGLYILCSMPGKIIVGTYQTMGNLAKSQWLANCLSVVTLVLTAILLWAHRGMKAIAALQPLGLLVLAAIVIVAVRRRHPELAPGIASASWSTGKTLIRPSLMFALITFSMLLYYQAQTLLVSITLGGVAVTIFAVSRTLPAVLRTATDTISDSITPDVCRLDALRDALQLGQMLRLVVGLCVCIGVSGAAAIWWEGGSVISVWTRGRLAPDIILLKLFAAVAIGQSVWVGMGVFGTATNRNRVVASCYFASNVIALAVSASLVRRMGVSAVPIGLLAGEAVACYHFMVRDACTRCGVRYASFAPKLWLFVALTSVSAIAAGYPAHSFVNVTVLRWLAVGCATTAVSAASTWFLWFGREQREAVTMRVASLFQNHRRHGPVSAAAKVVTADTSE